MRVVPKKLTGGTVKNASPIAVNGEYAVHYYAEIDANGKKLCEFDPLNFRYIDHTGKERSASAWVCPDNYYRCSLHFAGSGVSFEEEF